MINRTAQRGCGYREEGGVYAEVGLSKHGTPLETRLFDPVLRIYPAKMGLSHRTPILKEMDDGTKMLFDIIGEKSYPNPADILEEIRAYGLSRRLELPPPVYQKLDANQKLILIHPAAFILSEALHLYGQHRLPLSPLGYKWAFCPTTQAKHINMNSQTGFVNCASFHWQRVDSGAEAVTNATGRAIQRKIGSLTYPAYKSPDSILDTITGNPFTYGAIAMFEIKKITVVQSKDDTAEKKMKMLEDCQIETEMVEG